MKANEIISQLGKDVNNMKKIINTKGLIESGTGEARVKSMTTRVGGNGLG
jgi:hypothetical protein